MREFVSTALCALVALMLAGGVPASPVTEAWAARSPAWPLFPVTSQGPIFPADWVVAAGVVVDYSANLGPGAPSGTAASGQTTPAWLTIRVAVAVTGTRTGQTLTLHFRTPPRGDTGVGRHFSDLMQLTGGERVLVEAKPYRGKLYPVDDIYPLGGYTDDPVAALQEYARWNGLSGQPQLVAIANAARQSGNKVLCLNAMDMLGARGAINRAWAFAALRALAEDQSPTADTSTRFAALMSCNHLYKADEPGGVSGDILGLYEQLLSDPRMSHADKLNIVTNLTNRSGGTEGRAHYYRPRVLQIVQRFLRATSDPDLREAAQREEATLLKWATAPNQTAVAD